MNKSSFVLYKIYIAFQNHIKGVCDQEDLLKNFFFCSSQEILEMTEDYVIDIPQVCNYLGEIFGKFLCISTESAEFI